MVKRTGGSGGMSSYNSISVKHKIIMEQSEKDKLVRQNSMLNNDIEILKKENNVLNDHIDILKKENEKLKKTIDDMIMYAPGSKKYNKAKEHFESLAKFSDELKMHTAHASS